MKTIMLYLFAFCLIMAACTSSEKETKKSDETAGIRTETVGNTDSISDSEAKDTLPSITKEKAALLEKIDEFVSEKNSKLYATPHSDIHNPAYEKLELSYEERFIRLLQDNPMTLELPGEEIEKIWAEGFRVATSPDGNFRAYSWPTYRGGSMVDFCGVMQFRTPDGKTYVTWESKRKPEEDLFEYEKENGNEGVYKGWEWKTVTDKIHQLETPDGRVYLTQEYCTSGLSSGWQIAAAFAITEKAITRMPIFLEDGKKRSTIEFESYHEDIASHDFITYNEKDKSFSIQQYEDKESNIIVTQNTQKAKDNIIYRYDGKMFKKVKE